MQKTLKFFVSVTFFSDFTGDDSDMLHEVLRLLAKTPSIPSKLITSYADEQWLSAFVFLCCTKNFLLASLRW